MTVIVDPCQVATLIGSITGAPISYSLATPATTGAQYTFLEDLACGYDQSITVTGLPAFASHDQTLRQFSVETSDPSDKQTYTVVVESIIDVPVTYERQDFNQVTALVTFDIIVQSECDSTELDDFVVFDITVSVDDDAEEQTLNEVQDSVSRALGNQDGLTFCGSRIYELVDLGQHAAYMQLTGRTIQV